MPSLRRFRRSGGGGGGLAGTFDRVSRNVSGTQQALTNAFVDLAGCASITIAPTTRTVWVQAQVQVDITAVPSLATSGWAEVAIHDDLGNHVAGAIATFESSDAGGFHTITCMQPIDPAQLAAQRTYRVRVRKGGNANFGGQVSNGSGTPGYGSWLRVFTGAA